MNQTKTGQEKLMACFEKHTFRLSPDELWRAHERGDGYLYFIPMGFYPVLIPHDFNSSLLESATKVLDLSNNSMANAIRGNSVSTFPEKNVLLTSCVVANIEKKNVGAKRPPPRPRNAFIIFRGDVAKHLRKQNSRYSLPEISKRAGELWNTATPEEKYRYQCMANEEKIQHQLTYPNYRYCPNKPGQKPEKRNTQYMNTPQPTPAQIEQDMNIFNPGETYAFYDDNNDRFMIWDNFQSTIL
jgi:hypothetical protein